MNRMITLTTDFGLRDGYAGEMKGVILGINPDAAIIDISHEIEPQNVGQAAFVLGTTSPHFPPGTVHVVVVDPGVGTERKAILLETTSGLFLGPDNGVLSYVMEANPQYRAIALTNSKYWRKPVSLTFHGRDIFAPVAAHLSKGVAPGELGETVTSLATLYICQPEEQGSELVGEVVYIDGFGNLVTNIRESDLPQQHEAVEFEVGGRVIRGLSRSYAEGGELLAIPGSSDRMEIAARNGSAASRLGARIGQKVLLRKLNPDVNHA